MINLAYINGWDRFNESLYYRYLKAINNVDSTLSSIHSRSLEENQQERKSRLICSSKAKSRCVGEVNNQSK
jgi:hypothetical protein